MSPYVSVVIPTFNRRAKVIRAIQSVLAQTFTDFEILVIDDGDDDSERAIADEFSSRVRYLRGNAAGVAAARNLGIASARGECIAFLDADDWWYPTKLERFAEAAAANRDAGLFYSKMDIVTESGAHFHTTPIRIAGPRIYPAIAEGNFIFNSTVVAKKSCVESVGGFDTKLAGCEDWELWIRIARKYPAVLIDEVLVAYEYLSEGSFTRRYETWVKAHDEVMAKTIAADPELSADERRRIDAGVSYAKGAVYLSANEETKALASFKRAFALNRKRWRAFIYVLVLSWPAIRRALPGRFKAALRLPEVHA